MKNRKRDMLTTMPGMDPTTVAVPTRYFSFHVSLILEAVIPRGIPIVHPISYADPMRTSV